MAEILNVKDHDILVKFRDTMTRSIKSVYPQMDMRDISEAVEYSIAKRFKSFSMNIYNNYTTQNAPIELLEMCDYISKKEPIITSYGTLFRKHDVVPNPMAKVIQSFLDLRKAHKKEMFKYPKGSEMFERYNLLQALDKIDVNGIYGLIGLYMSILYDLNISPAITSTGRSLISSAIMCFESFLGNNVKFEGLNDVLTFIDHVRNEYQDWKFNDFEVLGSDGFADASEVFTKLVMNCGYKYIPSTEDLDIIYKILQSCNQIELNRLFYKNNLYCFMDLPIARNLMIEIVTGMQSPYIEPAKPPKEIVPQLNKLRDLLVEYVFYCHQYMDRIDRNKNMIKIISVVSDTDSSFVSLDAWYNYNLAYLKDYDCPIIHQSIDLFKALEEEKKSDDYYWKDSETPEWYNAIDKRPGLKFNKKDKFGDFVDEHVRDGIKFVDAEKDYNFYNEEVIEKQRSIDPLKIIPQDNMRFALINIMCYILTTVINKYMINFTQQSHSYRSDELCKINMKNEFYMSRILLTDAKKHYASLQILQEGNYLGEGVLDVKGIDVLAKSSTSKDTQKALKKILLEDILKADPIDQIKVIKDIAILEKVIFTDLKSGSKKYYKPLIVKSMDNYADPTSQQGVKAALAWNYVKSGLIGFDLTQRNPMDIVKIKVNKDILERYKEEFGEPYERIAELLDIHNTNLIEGCRICDVFKGKLDALGIPKDLEIPEWIKPLIDYESIIDDNLSGFPVSSIGVSQLDNKKANYTNIVKL